MKHLLGVFTPQGKRIRTRGRTADPIRSLSPDLIVIPLPDFKFTNGSARKLLKLVPEVDTVLIGNGMGKGNSESISLFVRLTKVERLVIDADGIDRAAVENLGGKKAILTPHEGEFRRVSGTDLTGKQLEEKMDIVKEFAGSKNVTVILKGPTDKQHDKILSIRDETI